MGRVAATDPRIGSTFAGYRIVALLGRGATSTVYRAVELRLEREVALKLLSAELTQDRRFQHRFLRESKLAASLQHSNVIPIFAAGEGDGQLYIAMRLVDSDLRSVLHEHQRISTERAVALCAQVAAALDAAHARGLVHRDVKPSNVLLEGDPTRAEHVFLADFGLSVARGSGSSTMQTEEGVGTIDYMAPEQIRGEDVDGRADLYSLGCLLYECVVGDPPFARASGVATLYAHLHDPVPLTSDRRPALPRAVDRVFERALAKMPGDRFQSGAELVGAFGAALGVPRDAGIQARRVWRRPVVIAASAGVLAAAVAAGAVAAVLAVDSGGGPPSDPHARVALPGYRVTASERLTSGAPGAHPTIGLVALIDDGRGRTPTNLTRTTTGQVVWKFDARQISFNFLLHAPRGTPLGYYTSGATPGGQFIQEQIVKAGLAPDASGDQIVGTHLVVPPQFARLLGNWLPLSIRKLGDEVVATFDLRQAVRRFHAAGVEFSTAYSTVYLLGGLHRQFARTAEPIVTNPSEPTTLRAAVEARPCLDRACTKLGEAARDAISIELPRAVSVGAPRLVLRGRRALFRGRGVPGDWVTVLRAVEPGSAPTCTPANFALRSCAPPVATAFEGDPRLTTRVRADGTWLLALPLPTSSTLDPRFGVSGRYAAAASPDLIGGSLLTGGSSSVLAEASHDTIVALAKPRLTVSRRAGRLAVAISVPGGRSARYSLRWRGRPLASGWLGPAGAAAVALPNPAVAGRFEVTVSAHGIPAATGSLDYKPGSSAEGRS
jgi:serine/threonine-protein kinase